MVCVMLERGLGAGRLVGGVLAFGGSAASRCSRGQRSAPTVWGGLSARGGCGAVGWWSGDRGGGGVLVELEEVAGEVDERPFAADGVDPAAAEAADLAVVFAVAEDGFDQAGALFVGGGALGGA